jgi:hypothetical protein
MPSSNSQVKANNMAVKKPVVAETPAPAPTPAKKSKAPAKAEATVPVAVSYTHLRAHET